jgi:hypothetical protein
VGPYLQRMETECISTVVVEAYDVIGAPGVIAGKFTVSVPLGPSSPSIHSPKLVIAALMSSALPRSPGSAVPRFYQSPTASQWPLY